MPDVKDLLKQMKAQSNASVNTAVEVPSAEKGDIRGLLAQIKPDELSEGEMQRKLNSYYYNYNKLASSYSGALTDKQKKTLESLYRNNDKIIADVERYRSAFGDEATDKEIEKLNELSRGVEDMRFGSVFSDYGSYYDDMKKMYEGDVFASGNTEKITQFAKDFNSRYEGLLEYVDQNRDRFGDDWAKSVSDQLEEMFTSYNDNMKNYNELVEFGNKLIEGKSFSSDEDKYAYLNSEYKRARDMHKLSSEGFKLKEYNGRVPTSADNEMSNILDNAFSFKISPSEKLGYFATLDYNAAADKLNSFFSADGGYAKYDALIDNMTAGDTSFDYSSIEEVSKLIDEAKNALPALSEDELYGTAKSTLDGLGDLSKVKEAKLYYDYMAELAAIDSIANPDDYGREIARLNTLASETEDQSVKDVLTYLSSYAQAQWIGKTDKERARVYEKTIEEKKRASEAKSNSLTALKEAKSKYEEAKKVLESNNLPEGNKVKQDLRKIVGQLDSEYTAALNTYKTAAAEYDKYEKDIGYYRNLEALATEWKEKTAGWAERAANTAMDVLTSFGDSVVATSASAADTFLLIANPAGAGRAFGEGLIKDGKLDFASGWQNVQDWADSFIREGGIRHSDTVESILREGKYAKNPMYTYDPSFDNDFTKILDDTAAAFGAMVPGLVLSGGLGVGHGAAQSVSFGLSAFSSGYEEAINNGASKDQAGATAILSGIKAATVERLADAITGAGPINKIGSKLFSSVKNPAVRTMLDYVGKSVGEGVEEFAESILDTGIKQLTYDPDAQISWGDAAYEGMIGSIVGGIMAAPGIKQNYQINRADSELVRQYVEAAESIQNASEGMTLYNELVALSAVSKKLAADGGEYKNSLDYISRGTQSVAEALRQKLPELLAENGDISAIDSAISSILNSAEQDGVKTAIAVVDSNIQIYDSVLDRTDLSEDVREALEEQYGLLLGIKERYDLEDYSEETDSKLTGYKGVNGVEYDLTDSDGKNVRAASDIKTGTVHLRTDLSEYGGTKKGVDNEKAHEVLHLAVKNDPKLLGRLKNMLKAQGVNFKAETAKLRDAYIEQYKKDWYRDNADSAYNMGEQNAEYQAKQYAEQKADATLEEEVIAKHFGKVASELGLGNIVSDSFMDRVVRRANTAVGREYNKTLNRKITKAVSQYAKTAKDAEKRKKRSERKAKVKEKVKAEKEAKKAEKKAFKLKEYSEKQKQNWKDSKRIVLYENDAQLKEFVEESLNNKQYDKKMYFGAVPTDLAELIKENTGVEVDGYNCSLSSNEIRKIIKDHGDDKTELPRGQRAVTVEDFLNIPKVIQSPDSVSISPNTYAGKKAVMFTADHNGKMTVVAVVSDKHLDLFVQTAYVGIKKGNLATPIGEQAPTNTSETSRGTVSDKIVSQPTEKVNTKKAKSQTSANLNANTVYTTHKQLKAGDKVGEVTLVRDSETGESVTPKLHASFDKYNTPSFVLATVESLGNEELIAALEEETVLMLADENAELPLHDTVEELSEYVKDGNITPEQAARILGNEYANPTGIDVDTLVARTLDDGVRYSVAGEGSATANGSMLAVAKYYWNTPGTDHANITAETGWWYDDVDGKWKYEISDSEMVFEPNGSVSDPQTLADYVKHDKLFAAYPQLKDVKFVLTTFSKANRNGLYDPIADRISLNKNRTEAQQKKTLIHEIQHAVQHIEGFAEGTNEDTAYIYLFNEKYKAVKGTAEYKSLSTPDERFDYIENSIDPDEIERRTRAYDQYKDSHGEVEARESADRMGYDDDDLRNIQRKTNAAQVIDRDKVNSEFVDILSELGYTEGEINLYRERSGITNDEQRDVAESDLSKFAWNDSGRRQRSDYSPEKTESGRWRREGRIPGRPEPLGRSDTGADTASERQYDNRIRYSLAEPDTLPAVDREKQVQARIKLAEGLQSIAQSSIEYESLERYKRNASKIVEEYARLDALNRELRELNTAPEKDTDMIKALKADIRKLNNDIDIYESGMRNISSAEPFREMLARATRRQTEEINRVRHDYYERQKANTQSRKNTETRNKIKRVIAQLDSLYMHPTKQRNVNNDIQEPVFAAISVGRALFANTTNAEIAHFSNLKLEGEEITALNDYRANLSKKTQVSAEIEQASKSGWDTSALKAELAEINAELKEAENGELKGLFERERNAFKDTKASEAIDELAKVYTTIQSFEKQPALKEYNDKIFEQLEVLKDYIGEVKLRDMNGYQLERLYGAYKMILHAVRRANQVFIEGKRAETTQIADACIAQFKEVGESEDRRLNLSLAASKAFWNERLPIYAVRYLGSDTFERLYSSLKGGQYVWARDVAEARDKVREIRQKYEADEWNSDELYPVRLENGASVELTLGQLMSIYAYSKRKQAKLHMSIGGFSLEADIVEHYKVNLFGKEFKTPFKTKSHDTSAHTYRIGDSDIETVKNLLGAKTQYVDEMQDYLSTTMAEKGNETSRELYGIDLFHETNYFPIISVEGYRQQASTPALQNALANSGMTKNTVPNADSPMALCNFDDVWTKHVNQMSSYHAFAVGIDSMNKVIAYNLRGELSNSKTGSMSFKDTLDNLYGEAAYEYFDKLIQDVNGGVHLSDIDNPLAKAFSLSKKAAVAASVSVMIQQPTAVVRAMAHVDAKYFLHKRTMNHAEKWEELKKYAPIAIIKEIGGYDAQSSRGAADSYIFGKEYGIEALDGNVIEKGVTIAKNTKDKLRGIWQDSEYRDSVLMWGAAEMDKIGWNTIWEAVKRETADKTALEGEALLEKAGERFTEVVELTQVYDSVFARSAYMRSNSDFMKASTAFMGEPTLTANMIMDAGVQLKRKKIGAGKFARIFGSVLAGVILADLLKSMWTVNREDNEEEPYFEMLLETYQKNIMGDLNPANYLPIARDISSMFEGYSADRDDLSLISDLVDGVGGWFDEDKALQDKIHNTFAPLSALAGVPIKNIVRDFRTVMNGINRFLYTITEDNYSSGEGLWQAFVEGSTDHPWLEWLSDSWREDYSTKQIDNELKSLAKATDEADEVDKVKLDRDPPKTLTIKDAKYTLSRADQRQWYDVRGAAAAELYTEFIDSMLYDTLSDEDKVKALGEIYSYANYLAKMDYCKANGIEYEDKTNSKLSDKLNAGYSIAQLMWEKYTFDEPKMKKTDKLAEIANSNMSMTDKLRSVYSLYVTEKENGELNTTKYDNIKAACDAGAPLSLVTKFMTYYSTIESSLDRRGDRVFKGVDGETADSKHELMERWLETTGHEMGDHGLVHVTDKMRYYIYAIAYPKSDNPFE